MATAVATLGLTEIVSPTKAATAATSAASAASAALPWLDVTSFGALGDGIQDDHPCIMQAYMSLPDSGGILYFPHPSNYYRITSPLTFGNGTSTTPSVKQNVYLLGSVPLSGNGAQLSYPSNNQYPTRIVYDGDSIAGHIVKFEGPMTCGIAGLTLDGNLRATYGLWTSHVFRSSFRDMFVYRTQTGIRHDSLGDVTGVSIGAADNTWERVHVANHEWPTGAAAGFDIGVDTLLTGLDVNRDVFTSCTVVTKDDIGSSSYVIRGVDLVTFINCMGYSVDNRRAKAVSFIAPSGPPENPNLYKHLPYEITFINCPLIGQFYYSPDWNVDGNGGQKIMFWPVASGDMTDPTKAGSGVPPSQNGFFGVDTRGYFLGAAQFRTFLDNQAYDTPGVMFRLNKPVTITNTLSPVAVFSHDIPANLMRSRPGSLSYHYPGDWLWDRMLRIRISGVVLNKTGADQPVRITMSYGNATIYDSGALSLPSSAGYRTWFFESVLSAKGLFNSQFNVGTLRIYPAGSATGSAAATSIEAGMSADTSIDMSVIQNLDATIVLGASTSDLAVFVQQAYLELM
ncbi:hypothetical protein KCV01_g16727, partial [Aureobasidium melanogenum]